MTRDMQRGVRLTAAEQGAVLDQIRSGATYVEAAAAVSCCKKTVQRLMRRVPMPTPKSKARSPLRLTLSEREEISRGLRVGEPQATIARRLSRSPSTISREIVANGGRCRYRAWHADQRALDCARRPKPAKLATRPGLRQEVERLLALRWSPQQIAKRLRQDHPDDISMHLSHETIYQSLFVQSRGALRRELAACLRSGRAFRRPQGRMKRPGQLSDMIMISERPAEVDDRAVSGHWEGDLIIGANHRSAIGTLVERQTRFVMLLGLQEGRRAEQVTAALAAKICQLPRELRRSLTWDQGKEMADHAQFTVAGGVQVYFCDPHSPWQRGSNENTNGLLRQYFPKGTDLSTYDQEHLDTVAAELNGRPRQTLDWMTPSEAFARAVAMTT